MMRRPPRSTRTVTLFPYTPLFRSVQHVADAVEGGFEADVVRVPLPLVGLAGELVVGAVRLPVGQSAGVRVEVHGGLLCVHGVVVHDLPDLVTRGSGASGVTAAVRVVADIGSAESRESRRQDVSN